MANLPPRPKSPLPLLKSRERVASAQPMVSRPRDDRHPPNRSRDTYIPSYREGRRDDRDRDRYRDHDRRDRYRRDWSPPSRRRDSPDRDRRPSHRGPRRYPSPRRGSYYYSRSRSPPPRRGSPSPRRYRSRTRSRSRSPRRSPKALRLGQHSVTNSPRSPLKRPLSRSRSRTPSKPPAERTWGQESDSKADIVDPSLSTPRIQESSTKLQTPLVKKEDLDISVLLQGPEVSNTNTRSPRLESNPVNTELPKLKLEDVRTPQIEDEVKSEPADVWASGMENSKTVDSPMLPTWAPKSPPRTSSTDEFSSRLSGSGSHRPRSPPRGPRAYSSHPRGGNTYPHPSISTSTQPYPGGRIPKRRQPLGIFIVGHKKKIHLADGEPVELPVKVPDSIIEEMDKTVAGTRRTAAKLAIEILQQSKHLSRQLHEFQLASMDLRAAENRRKMSEIHLEKARNGTLGIDYLEEPVETKT